MNILTTITGLLIAAVLNVPGTNQHEVAPVEEEPVVKGHNQTEVWYMYIGDDINDSNYDDDILDATKYLRFSNDPDDVPTCPGAQQICAVRLPDAGTQPDQTDLTEIEDDILDHEEGEFVELKQ